MADPGRVLRRRRSLLQLALGGTLIALILVVEVLILRAYVGVSRSTEIFQRVTFLTGALVNVRHETAQLNIKVEELPTSRDFNGLQVRRALLANQLFLLEGLGEHDPLVAATLQKAGGDLTLIDQGMKRAEARPTDANLRAEVAAMRPVFRRLSLALKDLYDKEEQQFFGALSETLHARARSERLLVGFSSLVLLVGVALALSLRRVVATSVKEYLPPLLRVLFTLARERRGGHRVRLEAGDLWLGDLLARHRGTPPPAGRAGPDDPASILMSGGTTGTPKGVVGLHRHYTITGAQIATWLSSGTTPWEDVVLAPLPLFHSLANIGVQSVALRNHAAIALVPDPRDLKDLLHTINQVRPTSLSGVPALYNAMINHPDVRAGKIDFSSVKVCFSGAAPLLAETKRRFEELTGGRIVEGYSLTEAMLACAVNPVNGPSKLGSVGMPLPDVEIRIVDPETGKGPLQPGEVGEVLIRAPQLMAGYWNDPEETAGAVRTLEGDRWLHTGDLGYLDEDGYLFIVDRLKDLIKTSGYQVWPREIEEAIAAHPAVAEVGVAGVPHEIRGEVAKAWVVLRPGRQATAEEIRDLCRDRLAPYKVPAQVEFRDALPLTMAGKVLRRALTAGDRPAPAL